jgi:hypothetical protein
VVQVNLPFTMEARPNFAAECCCQIAGAVVPVTVREAAVVAESGPLEPGEITINIRSPALISPASRGSSPDSRPLGLAIRVVNQ